jgi:hypothetical protein
VRNDSPDAREFIKASGLLHLLRFGRFPDAPGSEETGQKTTAPNPEEKEQNKEPLG